jgi:aminopeptidase N
MTKKIRREDYQPPIFLIPKVCLELIIRENEVEVTSTLDVEINMEHESLEYPSLILNGEDIRLISVELEGVNPLKFVATRKTLTIPFIPKKIARKFTLRIITTCSPLANLEYKGLFISDGILASHCEPEGFRRITYFLDRPDVLSIFTVSIEASKSKYPVMLASGTLLERQDVRYDTHRITWHDPFPKSCYLFAIVVGKLFCKERVITALNGNKIILQFWANELDIKDVGYALDCLHNAIQWEEKKYGLVLDLDCYKVAAIKNFPVGGMENKGLNIFSSRLICTNKDTTTDMGFLTTEGIVAHEFFHNWTGNRVACRDWFQLSLKEGLTVYRDQEFCSEQADKLSGKVCQRIQVVSAIRAIQFSEDSGSLAHSILPVSYKKIENFYTATTYIKSAEVVRMLSIIIGEVNFSKCLVSFLEKFDGKTATWNDFLDSFEKVSEVNLDDFKRWLYVKGTPRVTIHEKYSHKLMRYELVLEQSGIGRNLLHIPLVSRLVSEDEQVNGDSYSEFLINFKSKKETIVFDGITSKPLLSINRNFSAPIIIEQAVTELELLRKISLDDDGFIKWDSMHQLYSRLILSGNPLSTDALDTLKSVFVDNKFPSEFKAYFFTLPKNEYLYGIALEIDPFFIEHNKLDLYKSIAIYLEQELLYMYSTLTNSNAEFNIDLSSIGDRTLKNKCLEMLLLANSKKYLPLATRQFNDAQNLTDVYGALLPIVKYSCKGYGALLQDFYIKNKSNDKIVDMWISLHATQIPGPKIDVIHNLKGLIESGEFGINSPVRISNLLLTYFYENSLSFHDLGGAGYIFWSEYTLLLDKINPSLSAKIARVLMNWRNLKNSNKLQIEGLLRKMISEFPMSENLQEILSNMLES